METFLNAHPPTVEYSIVPDKVKGQLEHFGYTEGKPK